MALKITFPLIVGLLVAATSIQGQELDSRFIVEVGHFTLLNETVSKCAGTLISEEHILCTASCVSVQSPTRIAIIVRLVTLLPGGNGEGYGLERANGVFIHPYYKHGQSANNVAIVMTTYIRSNPSWGFVPRSLGSLSTSRACSLFGWGGGSLNPRRDEVMVSGPADCDPNNSQNFCTYFDSIGHATCSAQQGSPLTCGNDTTVAGFVTNAGGCTQNNDRTIMNYHSVDRFRDWIEGVLAQELPERDIVNFVVTVMEVNNETAVPRCFGTIISSNRVLTTATCATIDSQSPVKLEVETQFVVESTSSLLNMKTSQIYIHPQYNRRNMFENNVAVIQINGTFDERIVPRTLGNLQQNNSCQLFGWGPTDIRFTRGFGDKGFTRDNAITVNEPHSCDPKLPQAFCLYLPTTSYYTCSTMTGSPVTCGSNESVITGFLINNASCIYKDNRGSLSFHSVGTFTDWILNPTNAAVTSKVSNVFALFIIFISLV